MVKKAINAEAKTSLQPLSGTKKIDFWYPKGYRPSTKKNKDNLSQKHYNKVFNKEKNKAKSYNFYSANQPQT